MFHTNDTTSSIIFIIMIIIIIIIIIIINNGNTVVIKLIIVIVSFILRYNYHEYCYPNEDKSGFGQAVRFNNWKAVRYDGY